MRRPRGSRSTTSSGRCRTCPSIRRIWGVRTRPSSASTRSPARAGVAYLLKADHAIDLPRKLQIEFSGVVQAKTDAEGGEVTSDQIWSIFNDEYLPAADTAAKWGRFELLATQTRSDMSGDVVLDVVLRDDDQQVSVTGNGNGPVAAFVEVLRAQGFDITVYDYVEHALSAGGDAQAAGLRRTAGR